MEEITPEIAQLMLGKTLNNRNLNEKVISIFARDMQEGRWALTGDPIKLDRDGNLIDGRHRLRAIVVSGVRVTLPVTRGD